MIRYYGRPPFRAAVIHGGPGAPGSAAGLAAMAGQICGTSEPMQSGSSIHELIRQLEGQLEEAGTVPAVLIGHSWGAFLAALFAGTYPEMVKALILVGCPPLTDDYVPLIGQRRRQNLEADEREEMGRLEALLERGNLSRQEADRALARLGELAERSDCYDPVEPGQPEGTDPPAPAFPVDAGQHRVLWAEAAALRASGGLLERFLALTCPVTFIQGRQDPHPPAGIVEPLAGSGPERRFHILECCGHSPWLERRARSQFFDILRGELETGVR